MARRPSSWPERASTRSSGVILADSAGGCSLALFILCLIRDDKFPVLCFYSMTSVEGVGVVSRQFVGRTVVVIDHNIHEIHFACWLGAASVRERHLLEFLASE